MAHILDQSQTLHTWINSSLFGLRRVGQSFTTGVGVTNISQVKLWLRRIGADLTVTCDIYLSDTGANDDKPTGDSLGSKALSGIPTTVGGEEVTFEFDSSIAVSAETKYVVVIKYPDGAHPTNYLESWGIPTDSVYPDGKWVYSNDGGSTWTIYPGFDSYFKTYYIPPAVGHSQGYIF